MTNTKNLSLRVYASKYALMVPFVFCLSSVAWSLSQTQKIPVPKLNWRPCATARQTGFLCATAKVPINYAKPDRGTFLLALIKAPAQNPATKTGTLFWNPGGPGDAGTQYLPIAIQGFPKEVRKKFDIVSWDPRGMGGKTRPVVQCFRNEKQEQDFMKKEFANLPGIPTTAKELTQVIDTFAKLNKLCVKHAGNLLAHVSTADNARDLDLLRQAVGDKKLNYYGTSYGTFLGATYLNMFPDKVRAAVFDGAADPKAWAGNGPDSSTLSTFLRLGSDYGARDTVKAFFQQCSLAGPEKCAFAKPTPAETQKKWDTLFLRLQTKPLASEGESLNGLSLLASLQSSLYILRPVPGFERFPGWVAVGKFLQNIWNLSEQPQDATKTNSSEPLAKKRPAVNKTNNVSSVYLTSYGRQISVICGESPNPTTTAAYVAQAQDSYRRAGYSGWPFVALCAGWSARAAHVYLGPWNKPTPPVLVIGNTKDPATPYTSSQRMAKELANGHLLTVDGFGHTELLNPSLCAQNFISKYLITGALPPNGTRCPQNEAPFSQ